ncbi:hypothetical protein WOLCODRAFT_72453, partial [Wolfiporia cocos MD-104 SS10]
VMGPTGVGKTSFINLASGSTLRVGSGLESMTDCIQSAPPFRLDGYNITLVDTPGFDDTSKSDVEILSSIANYLGRCAAKKKYLSGVIYMHRITDNRVGGAAKRNFKMFMELCGSQGLSNANIVFNMWNQVDERTRNSRKEELLGKDIFFKPAIDAGAEPLEHDNTVQSAHSILRGLAQKQPCELQIQKELVRQHKFLCDTAAGSALWGDLAEKERQHQEQLRDMQRDIEEAIRQRDETEQIELEEARRELEEAKSRLVQEREKLRTSKLTTSCPNILTRVYDCFRRLSGVLLCIPRSHAVANGVSSGRV